MAPGGPHGRQSALCSDSVLNSSFSHKASGIARHFRLLVRFVPGLHVPHMLSSCGGGAACMWRGHRDDCNSMFSAWHIGPQSRLSTSAADGANATSSQTKVLTLRPRSPLKLWRGLCIQSLRCQPNAHDRISEARSRGVPVGMAGCQECRKCLRLGRRLHHLEDAERTRKQLCNQGREEEPNKWRDLNNSTSKERDQAP